MPRRSSGRGSSQSSSRRTAPRSPLDDFDDLWLGRIRERFDAGTVDLTRSWDRMRWHPSKAWGPVYQSAWRKPRVVIVPEGHRLARHQTFGGRFSLDQVLSGQYRQRAQGWRRLNPHEWPYGNIAGYTRGELQRRVGFQLPWQVIVCVKRRQRREVLHALRIAGKGGLGRNKPRRVSEASNVRC